MSLWGFDGEENTLATWSSLTQQFDDMVWNEFGETNEDHVVPDPDPDPDSTIDSTQFCRSSNGSHCKRIPREPSLSASTLRSSTSSTGAADSLSDISRIGPFSDEDGSEEGLLLHDASLPTSLVQVEWSDLGSASVDLPLESEAFGSDQPPAGLELQEDVTCDLEMKDHECADLKEEVQLYVCKEDASIGAVPFSVSDVGTQERSLEMFENENVSHKADSLLELGWENIGNLDDMEKLFRNDSSFEPVMVNGTDGLDWPSSSPPVVNALEGGIQFEKSSPDSERAAVKLEAIDVRDTIQSDFGGCLPELGKSRLNDVTADSAGPKALKPVGTGGQQQSFSCPETNRARAAKSSDDALPRKARTKDGTAHSCGSLPVAEKVNLAQAYRARRHAANRKRSEERFKRTTSYRKLSPGPPYNTDARQVQALPLRLPGQPPHLQPNSGYPLHYFPPTLPPGMICGPQPLQMSQGVPYIQLGYPIHPMSAISACPPTHLMNMPHPQPMYVDLQHQPHQGRKQTLLLPQPSPLASSHPFDASGRPPPSSPSMTKQEKLEKLRWRQRMQARIAVEQQQQLLAYQNGDDIEGASYLEQQQQQANGQHMLLNQPENPSTPTGSSERLMSSPLDSDQRLALVNVDVPLPDGIGMEDFSLEGSVLGQLKCTVSALDTGTRICIRDALYRLARSAMKRRASGGESMSASEGSEERDSDANGVDSSTASGPPPSNHSRATSMSMVETETNPIDRSIAKLLFSRPLPPVYGMPF